MSEFRDAQRWLAEAGLYPGPGLADVAWSPERSHLAARTRQYHIVLYRVDPPDLLWATEPDATVAGYEFMSESLLVFRHFAPPANTGTEELTVKVESICDEYRVQKIALVEPCRTYGFSQTGRFQLLASGDAVTGGVALADLSNVDDADPGTYAVRPMSIQGSVFESDTSFAWVSPDGTRAIVRRENSKDQSRDEFHVFNDEAASLALPNYPWAEPIYLWSPTGRWFGAVIKEQMPSNWDEIPVGSPNLRSFVAAYDGQSGEQLWSEEVENSFAPFEWNEDDILEAANFLWSPEDGVRLQATDQD